MNLPYDQLRWTTLADAQAVALALRARGIDAGVAPVDPDEFIVQLTLGAEVADSLGVDTEFHTAGLDAQLATSGRDEGGQFVVDCISPVRIGEPIDVPGGSQIVGVSPFYEPDGVWLDVFILVPQEDRTGGDPSG